MSAYRTLLNAHALKAVTVAPEIPDYHLMVGSAEELAGLPLLIYATSEVPKEIVQNMAQFSKMNNEDIQTAIANNEIEVNDFNYNIATLPIGSGVI